VTDPNRRRRVPIALAFAGQAWRLRRRLPLADAVIQLHRPGTELAILGLAAPKVRFVHLEVTTAGVESRWRRLPRLLTGLEARTMPRMARVYLVGSALYDSYRQRYPLLASRFRMVSNWYDDRMFRVPSPAQRKRVRADLAIGTDDEVILFVGRLEDQKNPLLLVDAVARLAAARPTIRLHIVGEGTLRDALERHAAALGIGSVVRFWGAVARDRVADAMVASDVLAITSITEAGPTVGFEALACGLPITMTAVGEVALVLAANAAAGEVVEATEEAVAAGLARVLDRPLDVRRKAAALAAVPFGAAAVLTPVYDDHRQLVLGSAAG